MQRLTIPVLQRCNDFLFAPEQASLPNNRSRNENWEKETE
jgi:hypothetical protein